jgi:hypothetical protein
VAWKASDPNGDELSAKIFIRSENDKDWILIQKDHKGNKHTTANLAINPSTVLSGRYMT